MQKSLAEKKAGGREECQKNSDLVSPGAILAPASVGPKGRGDSLCLKLRYVEVSRLGAAYKACGC